MKDEIKVNKANKSITFINNGIAFSQFGVADEILDLITNLQEENDILKRDIEAMKHNYNLLVRCIENGESMTQKFENGLTYQDYKSRNEKAIKLLKEAGCYDEETKTFCDDIWEELPMNNG